MYQLLKLINIENSKLPGKLFIKYNLIRIKRSGKFIKVMNISLITLLNDTTK